MRAIERPPLGVLVRYRLFGSRVPERYLAWAEHDIRSPWWPWLSSAPLPIAITLGIAMFSDLSIIWWIVALVGGACLGVLMQRIPSMRRATDGRRELAIRHQRGEITRAEWRNVQSGTLTWRIGLLSLGAGIITFVVLMLLDRAYG